MSGTCALHVGLTSLTSVPSFFEIFSVVQELQSEHEISNGRLRH